MERNYDKYGKFYNLFFWTGLLNQSICWVTLFYIGVKRYQRANPIGILFNLLIIQLFLSFRVTFAGIAFKIWGFDFIIDQVDGITETSFYCSFEGLYYYAFFLAECFWGVIWAYDYILTCKYPHLYTGKYLMYYSCVAYFLSFGFSIVVYFQNQDNFTSGTNLTCFVVDDNSTGYWILLNFPIVIFTLTFLYVYIKYGWSIESQYQSIKQAALRGVLEHEQNLISPEQQAQFNHTQMKLVQNIKLLKLYFVLWLISVIPHFFYTEGELGIDIFSIMASFHPLIIIMIIIRALSIGVQDLERGKQVEQKDDKNGYIGTEMSDVSISVSIDAGVQADAATPLHGKLITQFQDKVPLMRKNSKVQYRTAEIDAQYDKSMSGLVPKEQLDNFKKIVETHILKYILIGFQKTLKEKERPKPLYDKDLGFGIAPELNEQKGNAITEGLAYVKAHMKEFFAFNNQPATSQLSNKDNNEGAVLDGQVLGHPEILRKFPVHLKEDELLQQSKLEKVTQLTNEDVKPVEIFPFIELAPELFYTIRRMNHVDERLVKAIFSNENYSKLMVDVTEGKGGSFFVKPKQGGLILKSINKAEYNILLGMIADYYRYILMNPNTFLVPILGVFTVEINKNNNPIPIQFILMRNVMDFNPEQLDPMDLMYKFDIKGQVDDRRVLQNPREILEFDPTFRQKYSRSLYDQDFLASFRRLDVSQHQSEKIIAQIECDLEFLLKNNLMDYSLYLIIVLKPYKHVRYLKHFNPNIHDIDNYEEEKTNQLKRKNSNIQQIDVEREFIIAEIDPSVQSSHETLGYIVMQERNNNTVKSFHICDQYDYHALKAYYNDAPPGENDDIVDASELRGNVRTGATINFTKSHVSYQFNQFLQEKKKQELSSQQPLGQIQKPEDQKAYNCLDCKRHKLNHIASEQQLRRGNPFGNDIIQNQISKMTPREYIEQVVIDPHHGLMKREIHFGLIDYASTYAMQKRIAETLREGENVQVQIVKPQIYQERFIKTMKRVFQ